MIIFLFIKNINLLLIQIEYIKKIIRKKTNKLFLINLKITFGSQKPPFYPASWAKKIV
jgi:hypothetical protein